MSLFLQKRKSHFRWIQTASASLVLLLVNLAWMQSADVMIRLQANTQMQMSEFKVPGAEGLGINSQISTSVTPRIALMFNLSYDHLQIDQPDVLDIWEWDYWKDTYIEWMPGITVAEVNETLEYTSTDSIYSAVFNPNQFLSELRISGGVELRYPIRGEMTAYIDIDGGFNIYKRGLKMVEDWTKRYDLVPDTTGTDTTMGFDYEYKYQLTHFAPAKRGNKFFIAPTIGYRWDLTSSVDLDISYTYVFYFFGGRWEQVEDLVGFRPHSSRWYPLKNKSMIHFGLTFKY